MFDFATSHMEGLCAMRVAKLVRAACQAQELSLCSLGAKKKDKTQAHPKTVSLEEATNWAAGTEISIGPGSTLSGLKFQLSSCAGELRQATEAFIALAFSSVKWA